MNPPRNAAASGVGTGGGQQIERGSEIKGKDIRTVKPDADDRICSRLGDGSVSRFDVAPLPPAEVTS